MNTTNQIEIRLLFFLLLLLTCPYAGCVPFSDQTIRGEIKNKANWPDTISTLADRLIQLDANAQIQGYLLTGKPGRYSIEYAIFRIRNASENVFEAVSSEFELVQTQEDLFVKEWHREGVQPPPSAWWVQTNSETSQFYVSQSRLDGQEGDLYRAAFEPIDRVLFIEYYFDF
jgi:hypothetical protein